MFICKHFIGILLLLYGIISWVMAFNYLIYYVRCSKDCQYRSKQPLLWRTSIRDAILSATFMWLPIIIINKFVTFLNN